MSKKYNEQEVLEILQSYNQYSRIIDKVLSELDEVYPRTQNYGLEATLPKAPYGVSNPTANEVALRERTLKRIERYVRIVSLIQAFDEATEYDSKLSVTAKMVYSLGIAGKSQAEIANILELTHATIGHHQRSVAKVITNWLNGT